MRNPGATNRLSLPLLVTLCIWVASGAVAHVRYAETATEAALELWAGGAQAERSIRDGRLARFPATRSTKTRPCRQRFAAPRFLRFRLPPIRAPSA